MQMPEFAKNMKVKDLLGRRVRFRRQTAGRPSTGTITMVGEDYLHVANSANIIFRVLWDEIELDSAD